MDGSSSHQKRRRIVVIGAAIAVVAPTIAAQTPPRQQVARVGYLTPYGIGLETNPDWLAFKDELRQLGWIEGTNLFIEVRAALGDVSKLDALAADLATKKLDVVATFDDAETVMALRAMPKLPIVACFAQDPVGAGYAHSLARPGGNVTGMTARQDQGALDRPLQLAKDLVPELKRAGWLTQPGYVVPDTRLQAMRKRGIEIVFREVTGPEGIEAAVASLAREGVQVLRVGGSPMLFSQTPQIVALARKYRLPDIYVVNRAVDMGGLMSYRADLSEQFRGAAKYIDKILKGAKPSDLPFQQPTRYVLEFNMKAAREFGLTVPPSLRIQVTRFVE